MFLRFWVIYIVNVALLLKVSLTAPKLCAKKYSGPHHFLGGRFVPPCIVDKYKLHLPPYPGTAMCVRIGKPPKIDISALRENYISPEFLEEQVDADPINQVPVQVDCYARFFILFFIFSGLMMLDINLLSAQLMLSVFFSIILLP